MRAVSYNVSGVITTSYREALQMRGPMKVVLTDVYEKKPVDKSRYEKIRAYFKARKAGGSA